MTSKQNDVLSFFDSFEASAPVPRYAENEGLRASYLRSTGKVYGTRIVDSKPGLTAEEVALDVLPPDIGRLARGEHFSVFKKEHAEEAALVYDFLMSLDNYDDFKANVLKVKEKINEGIYMYAVSVAWLHRKDTAGGFLPPPWQINPKSYFSSEAIFHAKRKASLSKDVTDFGEHEDVPVFSTGTVRDTEFKLAWWREDVGLNGHHYHWHEVYPWRGINGKTKDREGELFYYMHQQMLARYDAERLGVGLLRIQPYVDWSRPIQEGYDPHLTAYYGAKQFSARPADMYLADNWTDPNNPSLVSQQKYHCNRLLDAINTGHFIKDDRTNELPLGSPQHTLLPVTIDSLGAAVEASISSPNAALYGSVHNIGHDLLASVTDPDGRYQSAMGVMGDNATAVRDPVFFRWHKFIDDLFVLHKLTLPPYTDDELALKDLTVKSVYVKVPNSQDENVLTTRMEDLVVDISHDMFLESSDKSNTPVNVKVKQVNHDKFEYIIAIDSARAMTAAIRIFIAPAFDEHGERQLLGSQRRLFIEMDKFVHEMEVGTNNITRSSAASSVIKPTDLTYDQLKIIADQKTEGSNCTCYADRYCECGWPEHMLLPRGTRSGMQFDLFVMATDWNADRVEDIDDLDKGTSYCGLKNENYPDKRSMGFPFDRKMNYHTIDHFVKKFTNMFTVPFSIKYSDQEN